MADSPSKDYLDFKSVIAILILTLLWGLNYPAIKYSNQGIDDFLDGWPSFGLRRNLRSEFERRSAL